ncbi:MAG: hypothetical protein AB8B63_09015 [Granulosicoccus sp.]
MTSGTGGKSESNVMNLEDARKKRQRQQDSESCQANTQEAMDAAGVKEDNETAISKPTTGKTGNRSFNHKKVNYIKGLIARGEYKINYYEVADKYIEHERFS